MELTFRTRREKERFGAGRAKGTHVTVKVNGETMVDDDFPTLPGKDNKKAAPTEGIIAFQAHAGYTTDRATFTASMAGACLPGVPISGSADLAGACALGPDVLTTGRVTCLARANSVAFLVFLIQRGLLKVGRKRLWRVRADIASSLPVGIRELLTRRRMGFVRSESP